MEPLRLPRIHTIIYRMALNLSLEAWTFEPRAWKFTPRNSVRFWSRKKTTMGSETLGPWSGSKLKCKLRCVPITFAIQHPLFGTYWNDLLLSDRYRRCWRLLPSVSWLSDFMHHVRNPRCSSIYIQSGNAACLASLVYVNDRDLSQSMIHYALCVTKSPVR